MKSYDLSAMVGEKNQILWIFLYLSYLILIFTMLKPSDINDNLLI